MSPTITAGRAAVEAVQVIAELEGAPPRASQRARLEAFPGWGPAAGLFETHPEASWAQLADQLDDWAAPAEVNSAARVVDTSFVTPPSLITEIYDLLRTAGFHGGAVLDLGCGSGAFYRHAPADMSISYTGVEADPLSARIAAALHPEATVVSAELQSVSLPRSFDAAVGNVPFSSANVHDSAIDFYGALHEYFLVRAVSSVRPGGYAVLVTSRHTLDAVHGLSARVRRLADMLAAIRLPSKYFAGTDVVADVLVLRSRGGEDAPRLGWQPGEAATTEVSDTIEGRYCRTRISSYFAQHPEMVAGAVRLTGHHLNPLTVDADDPHLAVAKAFAAARTQLVPYVGSGPADDFSDVVLADTEGRKTGSFHLLDGDVVRITETGPQPVARPSAELRALMELRDVATALVAAESDRDSTDAVLDPLRHTALVAYRAYVARFGPLNRGAIREGPVDPETEMPRLRWAAPQLGGFRADPDCPVVLAMERYDPESGVGEPAPILLRRVNRWPTPAYRADSPAAALAICLGEGRGLRLERIAELLGLEGSAAAFAALGELVYRDPATSAAVTARDYLCGDVRSKLRDAMDAAAYDPHFARNVVALQKIQPMWLTRNEIRVELGSPWVTAGDITDFCREVFDCRVRVEHVPPLASWEIDGYPSSISAAARIAYGTQRLDALRLLQIGLNGAAPTVYDEVYDSVTRSHRRVRNAEATEQAEQKLAAIAERFGFWIWESPQREHRIVERYNHAMNARVPRRHDGSHLQFRTLADGIELWPWQRDFIDQALSSGSAYAAHSVGLGKTLTAITLAMTLRQFGLANRPAYIVPNHLIEFCARLAHQSHPSGRFLIVTREDLHRSARRLFAAKVATGDWDLVIMTHEAFSAIPVPGHVEASWIDDQLEVLEAYTRSQGYRAKAVARAVRSLRGRLQKLRDATNDPGTLTWDVLGIDHLGIDEVDRFRRLPVATRAEGFSLGASKRATDLLLKISMLRRATPDRPHVALYSGTPWNNTLAEAYVWQRLCAPDQLTDTGLEHFDAWAAQFIRYETIVEVAPDGGGFRSKRRPAVVQNVPELRSMLSEFMSIVRPDTTHLQLPTPVRHTVVVSPTQATRDFMATLVKRADALRNRAVSAGRDNMLLICGDGRKVALDPNLVGLREAAPKLDAVADRVAAIYHRTRRMIYPGSDVPGAFQLVLCDLGTPKDGDSQSYGRIRAGLIARGVPADKVRFVHEADTPKAREALFAGCRSGQVAVLLGSTAKVGIGTNIQPRLIALHHVDPPWTAAAWEQRNGRAIRTGNHHATVEIYSYLCELTFDAFMYGIIERKARGFDLLSRSDATTREIEDLGDIVLAFAELKAAATGNTLLLRQHELTVAIRKMRLAHVTVQQNVRATLEQADSAEQTAAALQRRTDRLGEFLNHGLSVDSIDLSDAARAICGADRLTDRPRARWMDANVTIGFSSDETTARQLRVQLGPSRAVLWSAELPTKLRRRGAQHVAQWAHEVVRQWFAGAAAELDHTRRRAESAAARAVQAREAAAAADIAEPSALLSARAELEDISRRINDAIAA